MVTSKGVHPTMQHTQMQTPQNWDVLKQKKEWHVVFKISRTPKELQRKQKRKGKYE
jgi:hypothetical protein